MDLVKVVIGHHKLKDKEYKFKNSLQVIDRDAQAMFVTYDHDTFTEVSGIYVMKSTVWEYAKRELKHENIEFKELGTCKSPKFK